MSTFPTLSIYPIYPLKESRVDNTIKSDTEAGYVITRARYSKVRKKFNIIYQLLTAADKALLDTFIDTVSGATDSFTWVHPASGTSYTVRFEDPPEIELTGFDGTSYYYVASFTLVEV